VLYNTYCTNPAFRCQILINFLSSFSCLLLGRGREESEVEGRVVGEIRGGVKGGKGEEGS